MNNKVNTVIFVHPSMSVDFTFNLTRQQNYKIFSISTTIEIDKIDNTEIKNKSDYYFAGTDNAEVDYPMIQKIVTENNLNIIAVVNGIDASLYYNDFLAVKFLNLDLDLDYSKIRTNKFEVHQILEQNDIHTIPSLAITDKVLTPAILQEIESRLGYPLIVKPTENTASMAGFRIANNPEELSAYVHELIGQRNDYYGGIVDELIAQKYISPHDYNEYVIDFFSWNGQHYLQSLAIYDKETHNNELIYRAHRPIVLEDIPGAHNVINYVKKILTALKVTNGFTHNEVFWDDDESYYFIESNNRFAGAGATIAYKNCYGYAPIDTMFSLINGQDVSIMLPTAYVNHSFSMHIYNHVNIIPSKINVNDLESFQEVVSFYPEKYVPADFAGYTRSEHIAATIVVNNQNKANLERDIRIILEREQNGTLFS